MDFVDKLLRILTGVSLNQLCELLLQAISALEGELLSVWGKPAVVQLQFDAAHRGCEPTLLIPATLVATFDLSTPR
jgi:hypothetical protein